VDEDGKVLFEMVVEDGETLQEIDRPEEEQKWAVHGVAFDFDLPVDRDIVLVATKPEDLKEAAELTVSLSADADVRGIIFMIRFAGEEKTESYALTSGGEKLFQIPVGTACELTVKGSEGMALSAAVTADGNAQDEIRTGAGENLTVSAAVGAGENRVEISATEQAAQKKSIVPIVLGVAAVGTLVTAAAVITAKKRKK
jgi:hypothetical protein